MERAIFQGCPKSPLLFLYVIEALVILIRGNDLMKGFEVGDLVKKGSLLADAGMRHAF